MKSLVIGLGEIGSALYDILKEKYGGRKDGGVIGYDVKDGGDPDNLPIVGYLHICIPWCDDFIEVVNNYISICTPLYTIIHSSVPVRTTAKIDGTAFHSPVRGKHPGMKEGLLTYVKYLSFDGADHYEASEVSNYFLKAGIECKVVIDTKTTELGKLLALSRYGVYIAFSKEQEAICEKYGVAYHKAVTDFENTRTEGLKKLGSDELIQPLLFPFENFIGGHCTVEDMEILLKQGVDTPLLKTAYNIGRNTKVWGNCNIYPTAKIGKGCNIGGGCEIGNKVIIVDNVRIGAMTFIPEGVVIEDDVFVAPGVFFSNDKYPPSSQKEWGRILIKKGAALGMGAIILPGVTVGERAMIGAGSVVTKDVPDGAKYYGNPAHAHGESHLKGE